MNLQELHNLIDLPPKLDAETIFVKVSYEFQSKTDPFHRWVKGHKNLSIDVKSFPHPIDIRN